MSHADEKYGGSEPYIAELKAACPAPAKDAVEAAAKFQTDRADFCGVDLKAHEAFLAGEAHGYERGRKVFAVEDDVLQTKWLLKERQWKERINELTVKIANLERAKGELQLKSMWQTKSIRKAAGVDFPDDDRIAELERQLADEKKEVISLFLHEQRVAELERQIEIMKSRASQFESTVLATAKERDQAHERVKKLEELNSKVIK